MLSIEELRQEFGPPEEFVYLYGGVSDDEFSIIPFDHYAIEIDGVRYVATALPVDFLSSKVMS